MKMKIKIGFISDTHTMHSKWEMKMIENGTMNKLDHCDVICFCGDMSSRGSKYDVENFLAWFNDIVPTAKKIFIAGNHDFFWDGATEDIIEEVLKPYPEMIYLNDSGTEWMGLKFWGSPVQPWFHDWAFNRLRGTNKDGPRGEEKFSEEKYTGRNSIIPHWDVIPDDTDILIVHGPPYGKLDLLANKFRKFNENPHVGCVDLLNKVEEIKPKVVAFGHIHEGYGTLDKNVTMKEMYELEEKLSNATIRFDELTELRKSLSKPSEDWTRTNKARGAVKSNIIEMKSKLEQLTEPGDIIYINASALNEDYQPTNPPIIIDIEV